RQPLHYLPAHHAFPTRRSSDLPGDHVIVKIAVADMAEDRHAATRMEPLHRRRGLVDEVSDSRYGNGNVVFPAAAFGLEGGRMLRSEEHTSELQSREHLVCRLLL